ncbi:MAG: family 1 glycosylhydrolase [Patescibacteria group bacterium]
MREKKFLYGAGGSAYQTEGGNVHNDWWAWEKATPGMEHSSKATDHYHRFREDFALAKSLGHTAHRLSIEWSRIQPAPNTWNQREIAHYRDVLTELRRLGLKSFVTLHHFTNPIWVSQQGGWENPHTPILFAEYTDKIANELGDLVDFWITLNEPVVYLNQVGWKGAWPPVAEKSPTPASLWKRTTRVLRMRSMFAQAHKLAYKIIHQHFPQAQVGIANVFTTTTTPLRKWWWNTMFFQATTGAHDFIGVNYYSPPHNKNPHNLRSDTGAPIYPEGLTEILLSLGSFQLPIYVTENGLADSQDKLRANFIRSHLRAVEVAQAQGAHVLGYLHWSLLDNFEWDLGFTPRYGLVEVNYQTLERKPRPSAYVYKAIIEQSQG